MVVEVGAGQAEQIHLPGQRQLRVLPLHQGQARGAGEAHGSFLFSQLSSVVNRPISASRSVTCCSWVALRVAVASRTSKRRGSPSRAVRRQSRSWFTCASCSLASWANVVSEAQHLLDNLGLEGGAVVFSHGWSSTLQLPPFVLRCSDR